MSKPCGTHRFDAYPHSVITWSVARRSRWMAESNARTPDKLLEVELVDCADAVLPGRL